MTIPNINDIAYDGTSARIRLGSLAIPCGKIELSKEEAKREKFRRIGDAVARVRTLGILDVGDASIEVEAAVWARVLLPNLPSHGGMLHEFQITVNQRHPLISGRYGIILDRCCIGGTEQSIEPGEKPNMVKIPISVIEVFHYGSDQTWKSLAFQPTRGTAGAQALMF